MTLERMITSSTLNEIPVYLFLNTFHYPFPIEGSTILKCMIYMNWLIFTWHHQVGTRLISSKITTWPKSKMFQKNVLYQNILLVGITILIQIFAAEMCECKIFLSHAYAKILTSAKMFTLSKLKVFDKNLIHQKIS